MTHLQPALLHFFDHARRPACLVGPEGEVLHANTALRQLLGTEECAGPIDRFLAPSEDASIQRILSSASREELSFEAHLPVPEGVRRWSALARPLTEETVCIELLGEAPSSSTGVTPSLPAGDDALGRITAAIEKASSGILLLDVDHCVQWINAGASTLWGYGLDEVRGRHVHELFGTPEGDYLDTIRQLTRHDGEATLELCTTRRDGSSCWVHLHVVSNTDAAGDVIGCIAVAREVTARKQQEEALRQTEEMYRSLVEQSLVGTVVIQDGRFRYVNPQMAEIFGYTPGEMLALDSVLEIIHEDDRHIVRENVRRRVEGEVDDVRYAVRGRHRDGRVLYCELHGRGTRYEGRPAVVGILLDVTRQHVAEEALRESEARFRSLSEASSEAIILHRDGIVLEVNQAVHRLFGYLPEELEGGNAVEMLVAPESTGLVRSKMQAQTEEPYEAYGRHKEGSILPVEIHAREATYQNEPVRVVSIRDLSEQRAGEAENERLKRFYEQLLRQIPSQVAVLDTEGRYTYINEQSVRDPEMREWLTGRTDYDYCRRRGLDPAMADERAAIRRQVIEERRMVEYEDVMTGRDGSETVILRRLAPLVDEMGEVAQVIGYSVDLTERKRLEYELERSQERYRSLAQASTSVVWVTDARGCFAEPQPAFAAYTGQPWEEHRGFGWMEMIHPDDRHFLVTRWKEGRDARETFDERGRIWHAASESYRHFELKAVPQFDAEGTPVEWVGSIVDVHDRITARAELRAKQEELSLIVNLQQMLATLSLDADFDAVLDRVAECSARLAKADGSVVALVEGDDLVYHGVSGMAEQFADRRVTIDDSLSRICMRTGEPINCPDAKQDDRLDPRIVAERGIASVALVPLVYHGFTVGVLKVFSSDAGRAFTDSDLETLQLIAGLLSAVVSHVRAFERQQQLVDERAAALERLRQSEEHFRALVQHSSDVVTLMEPDGTIRYQSDSVMPVLGYRQDELEGKSVLEYIHPDDRAAVREAFEKTVDAPGPVLETEFRFQHADGSWRVLATKGSNMLNHPAVGGLVGNSRDVTDAREAERALEQSRERFRSAFDYASIGIALVAPDGRWLEVNHALCEMVGYSEEELLAGSYQEITHPDDLEADLANVDRMLRREIDTFQMEKRYFHRNGRVIWVLLSVSAVYDEAGEVAKFIAQIQDITERKRAEQELHLSNERFEMMAQNMPGMIYQFKLDAKGEPSFPYVSPASSEIYGIEPEAIEADPFLLLGSVRTDEDDASLEASIRRSARELSPWRWEGRVQVDGETRWLRGASTPTRLEDGSTLWNGVMIDITDRREAEEALREAKEAAEAATEAKSAFLAKMSHEIRTPMNGVIGMSELLLDTPMTSTQQEYVRTITNSGEALLRLIDDILDFSKIEAGKLQFEAVPFRPAQITREVADLLRTRAEAKGLVLENQVDASVPRQVVGDPHRLRQVLVNLVGNAVKFTEHGSVRIHLEPPVDAGEDEVRLAFSVRDTGIGMDEEAQLRLFQAFVQADDSTTREYGGTGLGLAISRQIVEMMGGEIEVTSEPERGSCFRFTVRCGTVPEAGPEGASQLHLLEGRRALIVRSADSDELSDALRRAGMQVELAHRGAEALQRLAGGDNLIPDLVLVADGLPDLSGSVLVSAIQAIRSGELPKVVYLHPAGDAPDLVQADLLVPSAISLSALQTALTELFTDASSAALSGERPDADADPEPPRDRRRILLVEDNATNRAVAEGMLAKLNVQVETASHGREALERVRSAAAADRPFDLVLMDCQMPVMDGFDATRAIRELEGPASEVPIIAVTANAMASDRQACLDAGMDEHLAKPFRGEALRDLLTRYLDSTSPRADESAAPHEEATSDSDLAPVARQVAALGEMLGEADLHDLLGDFSAHATGYLEDLEGSLLAGDAAGAAYAAHTLKGACLNFEAHDVATLAGEIEQMASEGRLTEAADRLDRLSDRFRELLHLLGSLPTSPTAES